MVVSKFVFIYYCEQQIQLCDLQKLFQFSSFIINLRQSKSNQVSSQTRIADLSIITVKQVSQSNSLQNIKHLKNIIMPQQRTYIDRPQTKQLKLQLSQNYIKTIAPHELLVESLQLQNKQILKLQQQYKKLLQETQSVPESYSQQEKSILETREKLKIHQRKIFVEQGLKANSLSYHEQWQKEKKQLLEVLHNKQLMMKEMKGHQVNVFFNLEEAILPELLQFVLKSDQIEQNRRNEYIEEVKWWKKRYEIDIGKDQMSQKSQ